MQVKVELEIVVETKQVSELPLFTSLTVIEELPVDPTYNVMFFEMQSGVFSSFTLINVVQVETFE